MDELIEELGRQHHGTRHEHADILPTVVEVVFLQHMVEERESSTLSAHRSFAHTRKPDGVIIGLGTVFGDHT